MALAPARPSPPPRAWRAPSPRPPRPQYGPSDDSGGQDTGGAMAGRSGAAGSGAPTSASSGACSPAIAGAMRRTRSMVKRS
eukprot:1442590-Prymnesium_polylepis.1